MHEESGAVLVSVEGPVGWIRLNRPDRLNVLDFALAEGLERSLAAFAADPAVRAVVLAGAGRSFMAEATSRSSTRIRTARRIRPRA